MSFILAKKLNMTQTFAEDGKVIPVTVLELNGERMRKLPELKTGDVVHVSGKSKGKGFTGAMKRHGFHGAPASHGHDHPRAVGSIGQMFPQHTRAGTRMAGRAGGKRATVRNSMVVGVDEKRKLLFVKGGVPGARGTLVKVAYGGKGE